MLGKTESFIRTMISRFILKKNVNKMAEKVKIKSVGMATTCLNCPGETLTKLCINKCPQTSMN